MTRRSVDIGGAELEAVIAGDGPITVVFENGFATSLEEWDAVVPAVARRARTVRYDHRRLSRPQRVPARSPADVLADLERLLAAVGATPPYVLVGHSWGGVIARLFAHAHPHDVAGLVFVDATHEALDSRALALLPAVYSVIGVLGRAAFVRRGFARQVCPPGSPAGYRARVEERLLDPVQWRAAFQMARAEGAALAPALARLRRDCPDLPPIPIHVLTAASGNKSARRVHDAWRAAVARAPAARLTDLPGSGHLVPIEAAGAVIAAVDDVLEAVTLGRTRLAAVRPEIAAFPGADR
jgi:pimeloyl-ACP methyl ester carboxylesterase